MNLTQFNKGCWLLAGAASIYLLQVMVVLIWILLFRTLGIEIGHYAIHILGYIAIITYAVLFKLGQKYEQQQRTT